MSSLGRLTGFLAYVFGAISMAFAVVRGLCLGDWNPITLWFALCVVTLGALANAIPTWWQGGARYQVTRDHVVWTRGPFRRVIERGGISFARILWSSRHANVGTLELVRAVPVGPLRRRLALRLEGIEGPDGVWAIVRNAHDVAPAGHGELPIGQRLDRGEHILWAAKPLPSLKAYLPVSGNQWSLALLTAALFLVGVVTSVRAMSLLRRLNAAGLGVSRLPFLALIVGLGLAVTCVFYVAVFLVHQTLFYRARMLRHTRYLISNKRVLIQCGREELHLDRRMIVDIIETPAGAGTLNLFLVLDGPRARALASSGAFGERSDRAAELLPIFEWVQDGEGAKHALGRKSPSLPPLPWAA
ncbi:MAG TPA: hypothetical protein VIV60_11220 [Polyangiaceae bacterium]